MSIIEHVRVDALTQKTLKGVTFKLKLKERVNICQVEEVGGQCRKQIQKYVNIIYSFFQNIIMERVLYSSTMPNGGIQG